MSRKFPPGRCAHCLKTFHKLTSDHVFPLSWYPETTPPNVEKWQMPSCIECNQRFERIEEDLFLRIALGVDSTAPEAAGIAARLHRSVNPAQGRDARDRRARKSRRAKFRRNVLPPEVVRRTAIQPHFGPYPELAPEDQISVGIRPDFLNALAEKIIRGGTYVLDDKFIEADQSIVIWLALTDEEAAPIVRTIERNHGWYEIGPGFRFGRAEGFFAIQIWGRLRIYGAVHRA